MIAEEGSHERVVWEGVALRGEKPRRANRAAIPENSLQEEFERELPLRRALPLKEFCTPCPHSLQYFLTGYE